MFLASMALYITHRYTAFLLVMALILILLRFIPLESRRIPTIIAMMALAISTGSLILCDSLSADTLYYSELTMVLIAGGGFLVCLFRLYKGRGGNGENTVSISKGTVTLVFLFLVATSFRFWGDFGRPHKVVEGVVGEHVASVHNEYYIGKNLYKITDDLAPLVHEGEYVRAEVSAGSLTILQVEPLSGPPKVP